MPDGWLRQRGLAWKWKWWDLRWKDDVVNVWFRERRLCWRGPSVTAAQKKQSDGLRRSTDVAWWVNQRILVNLKARLDKGTFVEELENM